MASVVITAPRVTINVARGRTALYVGTAVFALVTALAVTPRPSPPTTYGAAAADAAIVGLTAGFGLLAAGVATSLVQAGTQTAAVTIALGTAWLANDWVGWEHGPALARSVAMVAAPFLVPLTVHVAAGYPARHVRTSVIVGLYAVTAVYAFGRAMFRDPFLDLGCWSNCSVNSLLVRPDRDVVDVLDAMWLATASAAAVLTIGAALHHLVRATAIARRSTALVLVAACVVATGSAVRAWLADAQREDPTATRFHAVYLMQAGGLLAIAAGVGWRAWRVERTRRSVRALAAELGATPSPGALGVALARSLGDDGLRVAYWLGSSGRFVVSSGRELDPMPGPGQRSTSIVRDGEAVAVVIHDALTRSGDIGAAARVAIDNERLRAEILARLADVRESRARIVVAADSARRSLERDLHDGAQQHLLAATFELRQAQSESAAVGDVMLAQQFAEDLEHAAVALDELRELAHGIYPVILTEAGLAPAVRALAARAAGPVEIGEVIVDRVPYGAEATAYAILAEALAEAVTGPAEHAIVNIADLGEHLAVQVVSSARTFSPNLRRDVEDRAGAVGGSVEFSERALRALLPCGE